MALSVPAIMKTTAARLSALYLLLFAICAVALVFYMTSLSARMLMAQTQETINDEVLGLAHAYQRGGLPVLAPCGARLEWPRRQPLPGSSNTAVLASRKRDGQRLKCHETDTIVTANMQAA